MMHEKERTAALRGKVRPAKTFWRSFKWTLMYFLEIHVIVEPHGFAESAESAPEQIWKMGGSAGSLARAV
jgi:hypothetical protein